VYAIRVRSLKSLPVTPLSDPSVLRRTYRAANARGGNNTQQGDYMDSDRRVPDLWMYVATLDFEDDLRRQLRRLSLSRDDIDDVVQETYARVLNPSMQTRAINQSVRGYVWSIALNVAHDLRRKNPSAAEQVIALLSASDPVDPRAQPDEALNAEQEISLLRRLLRRLPPHHREVVWLSRVWGYQQKEIADQLGLTVRTVNSYMRDSVLLLTPLLSDKSESDECRSLLARILWRRRKSR